jgi:hypothetical protein
MSGDAKTYTLRFRHDVIEGTSYEAGRSQGEELAEEAWRVAFTGRPPFLEPYTPAEAAKALAVADRRCPGIADEIRGASETSGVPIEWMTFLGGCVSVNGQRMPTLYSESDGDPVRMPPGGCSHFYLPRRLNPDGHVRLGVNYDSDPRMQELRLCTTRIQGKAAHISFSDAVFGRINGLNEHGVGVTSSLGSPLSEVRVAGLPYFVVMLSICSMTSPLPGTRTTFWPIVPERSRWSRLPARSGPCVGTMGMRPKPSGLRITTSFQRWHPSTRYACSSP